MLNSKIPQKIVLAVLFAISLIAVFVFAAK